MGGPGRGWRALPHKAVNCHFTAESAHPERESQRTPAAELWLHDAVLVMTVMPPTSAFCSGRVEPAGNEAVPGSQRRERSAETLQEAGERGSPLRALVLLSNPGCGDGRIHARRPYSQKARIGRRYRHHPNIAWDSRRISTLPVACGVMAYYQTGLPEGTTRCEYAASRGSVGVALTLSPSRVGVPGPITSVLLAEDNIVNQKVAVATAGERAPGGGHARTGGSWLTPGFNGVII